MKDKPTEDFLSALEEVEKHFLPMVFERHSFLEKGPAYYVQYKKGTTIVEFLFGAPEFHVEIIVYTSKGKFEFRHLLEIPAIAEWFRKNRYVKEDERGARGEILWYIQLLKFSIPILE